MRKLLRLLIAIFLTGQLAFGQVQVTTFGLDYNQSAPSFPNDITHGCGRMWDVSPNLLWGGSNGSNGIETAHNTFVWTQLDLQLETMKSHNVNCALMVMGKTPSWASSMYSVTHSITCHTYTGSCDPPSDLTGLNGVAGANQYFRDWVGALASHVNQPGYLAGTGTWAGHSHARLYIYETWNEPDSQQYFSGTYDMLSRFEWDIRCIVKLNSGTNPVTGESCATIRGLVTHGAGSVVVNTTLFPSFPANAIDTSAIVFMPSFHSGGSFSLDIFQAALYCTGPQNNWHSPHQSCTQGSALSNGTDAINQHMKYGNNWPTELEPTADSWVTNVNARLSGGDLAKDLYNSEGGSQGGGWGFGPYTKANGTMQASYVARYYLYTSQNKKIPFNIWYNWSHGNIGSSTADIAYTQVEKWMVGFNQGANSCTHSGNVYQCPLTGTGGYTALAVWNQSGTTSTFSVPAGYSTYKDLTGGSHSVGATVPIGYSPILLVGTSTNPVATFSPASLNFGSQTTGTTSGALTVTMTNSGGSNMTITNASLQTGTQYAFTANTCWTSGTANLASGANCHFTTTFHPTTNGLKSDNITVTDSAAGSPHLVPISGTGVTAGGALTFSPGSLTFPTTIPGNTSPSQTIVMTNSTGVSVTGIVITLVVGSDFVINGSSTCGSTLTNTSSCNIVVTFRPSTSGALSDYVNIVDSDASSPQQILLSGVGVGSGQPQTHDVTSWLLLFFKGFINAYRA